MLESCIVRSEMAGMLRKPPIFLELGGVESERGSILGVQELNSASRQKVQARDFMLDG